MSIKEFSLTESRPTVGVVIPTIGRESFRRAIESVRCQTFPSDQIVVVLDRPESREQVESILMSNERLIVTTGALGGSACRNIGLEALSQDFVCFLDDDDWWDSSKLEYQVQGILADRSLLCFTGSIFHEEGKADRRLPREPFTGSSVASYLVQRSRLTHGDGYIQTSSLMVETVLAKRIRWDDSLPKHQDWDFIVRLLMNLVWVSATFRNHWCMWLKTALDLFQSKRTGVPAFVGLSATRADWIAGQAVISYARISFEAPLQASRRRAFEIALVCCTDGCHTWLPLWWAYRVFPFLSETRSAYVQNQ